MEDESRMELKYIPAILLYITIFFGFLNRGDIVGLIISDEISLLFTLFKLRGQLERFTCVTRIISLELYHYEVTKRIFNSSDITVY